MGSLEVEFRVIDAVVEICLHRGLWTPGEKVLRGVTQAMKRDLGDEHSTTLEEMSKLQCVTSICVLGAASIRTA